MPAEPQITLEPVGVSTEDLLPLYEEIQAAGYAVRFVPRGSYSMPAASVYLKIVTEGVAEAFIGFAVAAVIRWARRMLTDRSNGLTTTIYGPDGRLLKEVTVYPDQSAEVHNDSAFDRWQRERNSASGDDSECT